MISVPSELFGPSVSRACVFPRISPSLVSTILILASSPIRLSRAELGGKVFNALFRILHGESKEGEEYNVETHFVVRESTGPALNTGH